MSSRGYGTIFQSQIMRSEGIRTAGGGMRLKYLVPFGGTVHTNTEGVEELMAETTIPESFQGNGNALRVLALFGCYEAPASHVRIRVNGASAGAWYATTNSKKAAAVELINLKAGDSITIYGYADIMSHPLYIYMARISGSVGLQFEQRPTTWEWS